MTAARVPAAAGCREGVALTAYGIFWSVPYLDTSAEAEAVQLAVQRRLSGVQRLRLAWDMSQAARDLAIARLRALSPTSTEAELRLELLRLVLPVDALPAHLR
jgi:hypothetical protein